MYNQSIDKMIKISEAIQVVENRIIELQHYMQELNYQNQNYQYRIFRLKETLPRMELEQLKGIEREIIKIQNQLLGVSLNEAKSDLVIETKLFNNDKNISLSYLASNEFIVDLEKILCIPISTKGIDSENLLVDALNNIHFSLNIIRERKAFYMKKVDSVMPQIEKYEKANRRPEVIALKILIEYFEIALNQLKKVNYKNVNQFENFKIDILLEKHYMDKIQIKEKLEFCSAEEYYGYGYVDEAGYYGGQYEDTSYEVSFIEVKEEWNKMVVALKELCNELQIPLDTSEIVKNITGDNLLETSDAVVTLDFNVENTLLFREKLIKHSWIEDSNDEDKSKSPIRKLTNQ